MRNAVVKTIVSAAADLKAVKVAFAFHSELKTAQQVGFLRCHRYLHLATLKHLVCEVKYQAA